MASPADESSNPIETSALSVQSPKLDHEPIRVGSNSESGTGATNPSHPSKKKTVGFTGGTKPAGPSGRSDSSGPSDPPLPARNINPQPLPPAVHDPGDTSDLDMTDDEVESHLPVISRQQTEQIYRAFGKKAPVTRPKPAIRRTSSRTPISVRHDQLEDTDNDNDNERSHRRRRQHEAFERGKKLERDERSHPSSRQASPIRSGSNVLSNMNPASDEDAIMQQPDVHSDSESDSEYGGLEMPSQPRHRKNHGHEAAKLVRRHRSRYSHSPKLTSPGSRSGVATPAEEQHFIEDYQPHPQEYRGGVLSTLLKLYNQSKGHPRSRRSSHDLISHSAPSSTPEVSPSESGTVTPTGSRRWLLHKHREPSSSSLAQLVGTSVSLGTPLMSGLGEKARQRLHEHRADHDRRGAGHRMLSASSLPVLDRFSRSHLEEEIKITVHIAETIARQKYLMRLCQALMLYGAPTHRLEEYMRMSARVLQTDAQFLYIPGAMIMSFDDADTHTTEVKLVKVAQGLDLGKLRDVHDVYKEVVHDKIGVEEATQRLKDITARSPKHSRWLRIPMYGFAAVCVGPFAFSARLIDLPIAFLLGCILGVLQLVVAPASDLYANVFEITASVITSFLARAFGSIRGGELFCFSALAQSSIALILPGYVVLCASLELQSKSIVAGSVRMVYAIIYSLFLGFGITIGTSVYGILDKNATSATTCKDPLPAYWALWFVPGFTLCLIIINQAKWKQAPVMLVISFTGYVVSLFSSRRFAGNTQVSSSLGALAIGVLANLYSRVGPRVENYGLDWWEYTVRPRARRLRARLFAHYRRRSEQSPGVLEGGEKAAAAAAEASPSGPRQPRRVGYSLAAAAMLPAIFVLVPSGLAVSGSLVSGIASADQISGHASNGTTVVNSTTLYGTTEGLNSIAFNVSYSVIQVAIGITVGLFLSAIVVYPVGKRRSGLFSF